MSQRASALAASAAPPLLLLVGLFAAWETYVAVSGINAVTLPAPSRIVEAGWRQREALFDNSLVTLWETAAGLTLSVIVGVGLALLIDMCAPLRRGLYSLLVGSQSLPIVVIAPLMVLWFGFDLTPKLIVV